MHFTNILMLEGAQEIRPLAAPVGSVGHTVVVVHGRDGVVEPPVKVGESVTRALPHPVALPGLVVTADPVHTRGRYKIHINTMNTIQCIKVI
jgi:hypothetical protein